MSAAVIELSEFVARRRSKSGHGTRRPSGVRQTPAASRDNHEFDASPKVDFCFWQGMSGQRYVHHVYSLIGCPQVPAANYVLFGRNADGVRSVLLIGRVKHQAPSLNLAEIRHRGAKLGACEVHVHLLAASEAERRAIEADLRSGFSAAPGPDPLPA